MRPVVAWNVPRIVKQRLRQSTPNADGEACPSTWMKLNHRRFRFFEMRMQKSPLRERRIWRNTETGHYKFVTSCDRCKFLGFVTPGCRIILQHCSSSVVGLRSQCLKSNKCSQDELLQGRPSDLEAC